ncbi:Succinyl-CoA synthetase-like [Sesbania bispinosa]|nr:Succinyl-CoA synthetase-like [Sesbania bispinosa]
MARKKIREYHSKRLLKEHLKRLASIDLEIQSLQVTESTDFVELTNQHSWLSSTKLVVKPDMLFGKRGKSGLVALNLDVAQVAEFVKARLGVEVEMGGCKAPITTFIVEPFVPHDQEFYLSVVSERLGSTISFSECGGIEIEENWDKVKTIFLPTEKPMTLEACAPLIATLPLEIRGKIGDFIMGVFAVFQDLDFSFLEMNPFTLVNEKPYPLDMRGELDDTAAFKNFNKWGNVEFPLPFGRVLSPTESFIHSLDDKKSMHKPPLVLEEDDSPTRHSVFRKIHALENALSTMPVPVTTQRNSSILQYRTSASLKFTILNPKGRIWTMVAGGGASVIYADTVGDLGYASELGNYAEYSGAPNEEEVLQYARVVIDCATADPDGRKRALLIGGGIANFTDVAATFSGIIRALKEKESKLKAARMHIYVRRGGPNYQTGLAKMRALGEELGVPIQVYGPEATMTGICKQAIDCIMSEA